MSKKVKAEAFNVAEEKVSEYICTEKIKKTIPKGVKKAGIIVSIVLATILILLTAWQFISYDWRMGNKTVPVFLSDMGAFKGSTFRYFDGITVNGVDISGMSVKKAESAINENQNAKTSFYNITLISRDKSYVLSGNNMVLSTDSGTALKEAKEYCISVMEGKKVKMNKNFTAKISVDKEAMKVTLEAISQKLRSDPVDATFDGLGDDGLIFAEHKDGIDFDDDSLAKDIENFLLSSNTTGEINATPAKITQAKITVDSLKENIQLIGTHTTTAGTVQNSNKNMRKAMEMCNGSVIAPGGTWSFNACTGNSNLPSGGWLESTVIMAGEYVQGYGGGICQASTTIYNAALYANMKVVTRYNHAYPSTYAAEGLDATIDYPGKDLVLQNTSEYPMYMQCIMVGKKLTVNIYGCPDSSFDKITLTSQTTETVENSHYIVASYRHYWRNGWIYKTEFLDNSRYVIKSEETEEATPETENTIPQTESQPPVTEEQPPEVEPEVSNPEESTTETVENA